MKILKGGVCAPLGFKASGVHCGIRKNKTKEDLALVVSDVVCSAAAVYTTNKVKGGFIGTERCLREGKWFTLLTGANTTIGCVMTNAKLTKVEANKLASITHNAYAKHISPVHTDFDGDTIFTMNTGVRRPYNFLLLQVAAVEAMGRAIMNAASGASYKINYCEESAEGGEQQEESAENGEE